MKSKVINLFGDKASDNKKGGVKYSELLEQFLKRFEDDFNDIEFYEDVVDFGHSDDDFEENYINRTALILKPLQPFSDWLMNLYPGEKHDLNEMTTYLISLEIEDEEAFLKKKFDDLFIRELEGWHTNKKDWPQKRTYKMFKQWFQVEVSTMVYDLENEPVFKGG